MQTKRPNQYAFVALSSLENLGDRISFKTLPSRDIVSLSPIGSEIEFFKKPFY